MVSEQSSRSSRTPHQEFRPGRIAVEIEPAAEMTRTSLILPEDLAIDIWAEIGENIFTVSESSAWWLGDWLIFGERKYPDRYKRAMQSTSLDYQTLRNYAWAARKFQPSRRHAKLSLQHHIEVAALKPEDQDHWLGIAERLRWSRDELRRQIRASVSDDAERLPRGSAHQTLAFARERVEYWGKAASIAGIGLTEWIVGVLDAAANKEQMGRQWSGPDSRLGGGDERKYLRVPGLRVRDAQPGD
jgi:hypothetical protein